MGRASGGGGGNLIRLILLFYEWKVAPTDSTSGAEQKTVGGAEHFTLLVIVEPVYPGCRLLEADVVEP